MDENRELEERFAQLTQDLRENNIRAFRNSFLKMHIYEQGQFYQSLTEENRQLIYSYLSPKELADVFDTIEEDNEHIKECLDEMRSSYAADMLSKIYTDNAVGLLSTLDKKQIAKYLSLIPADDAGEIEKLPRYENETAGAIMTTESVPIVTNQTVRSAMYVLGNEADVAGTTYYVYIINQEGQLVGVISLRDLIMNDDDAMISDLISKRMLSVYVDDGQEDMTQAFRDYDFSALPVTDYNGHLLGAVTVNDVIGVVDDEAASDYSGLVGVSVEEINESPVKTASRRLPWLITLLSLGMSTASLIGHYKDLVSEASILVVLISLITGTVGDAKAQSLAVAACRPATSDEKDHRFVRLILAEVLTGIVTGTITGITVFLIVGFWRHNFILGFVIGMAMLFIIAVANLAGSLTPILMDRPGSDPAAASGPFITTLSDSTSVLIYFNIASLFMGYSM